MYLVTFHQYSVLLITTCNVLFTSPEPVISECCYDDTIKHFSHIYILNPTWPPCDVFVLLLFYVKIDKKKLTLNGHHVVFADETHWSQSWWKTNQWTAELILLITCWFQIWSDRINKSRLLSPAALQRSELWRERCLRPFWGSGGRDRTSWCSSRGGLGPAQVRLQVNSDAALMSLCWTGFLINLLPPSQTSHHQEVLTNL